MAMNPIAKRVKAHKKQARGMLTPGLGVSTRAAKTGQLPALFTHFSVGKAKEASSAMRMLNHRRMGKMQAETGKVFAQAIPQKFKEVQKLLHINPSVSREESIWSEVEKTLPTQSSLPQYEEPAQPGEMRAGSRIQKFSIMPQEGQSIASFKKQTSALAKEKSTRRAAPQKPNVDPKARLFSRVQEVSSSQEKPVEEIPERSPEPPASVKKDRVQRQADTAPAPPKQMPVSAPRPLVQETEETPLPEEAQTNAEIFKSLSAALDGKPVDATPEPKGQKEQINPPAGNIPVKKVLPAQAKAVVPQTKDAPTPKVDALPPKTAMPVQAKPVERKTETKKETPRSTAKALPVAKPVASTAPTVQRKVDTPAAKPVAPTTVQRKADAPVAKPSIKAAQPTPKETLPALLPKGKPEAPRATRPEKQEPAKADVPPPVDEKVSVYLPDESPQPDSIKETPPVQAEGPKAEIKAEPAKPLLPSEMPLHRKIQARREAPKAIKALHPERVKPAESKPLLAPPPRPLLSREKYTLKDAPAAPPTEEVIQRQVESAPEAAASSTLPAEFSAMDSLLRARTQPKTPPAAPRDVEMASRQKLSMALAKPPRIVQTVSRPPEKQPERLPEKRQDAPRQEERPKPEPPLPAPSTRVADNISVSKQKVVQRQPADDTSESVSSAEVEPPNLNQLAEDVLPYVKRILEIESERTPGSLR